MDMHRITTHLVRQAGQSLAEAWQMFWPDRCCLCAQPGMEGLDLCRHCLALAWSNHPACRRCALPLGDSVDDDGLCGSCQQAAGPLLAVHAAWRYADPLDTLVQRYKFAGDLAAGRTLAGLMARSPPSWLCADHVLMPVPLHRQRLRSRGFDQSRELVRLLARLCGLQWQDGLTRVVTTAAQSGLTLADRRRNLSGAFQALSGITGPVVLVDDVMTSGATLTAAAKALQRAGVTEVRAWVAARTP